ncbi:MAG: hypothetical protein HYR60_32265, partial [Acidobacteria bacterium]|nr:hypothetical protein [Acidobacteriota bacterium]
MKVTGGPTGPAPSRVPNHEQQIQTALMQTPKDQKGLQHQHQQLQQLFKSLSPAEAQHLQAQLQANKKGDAMAANFHKLPAATQKDLNGILAKHHAPPQHVQPHAHEPAVTGHKVAGRGSATQQVGALVAKGQFAKQQAPAAPAAQQKSTFGSFVNKVLNPPAHQPGVYQAPTPSKPTFIEKGKKPIFEGRSKGTTTTKSPDGK